MTSFNKTKMLYEPGQICFILDLMWGNAKQFIEGLTAKIISTPLILKSAS